MIRMIPHSLAAVFFMRGCGTRWGEPDPRTLLSGLFRCGGWWVLRSVSAYRCLFAVRVGQSCRCQTLTLAHYWIVVEYETLHVSPLRCIASSSRGLDGSAILPTKLFGLSFKTTLQLCGRRPALCVMQAISVWSNNSAVPSANANTFSSDESGTSGTSDDDSSGEEKSQENRRSSSAFGPRSVYRNSLRLSRKWVRKGISGEQSSGRPPRPNNYVALATSPCGCMFAAVCKGSEDVTVWLRRRNMPPVHPKPWDAYGGGGGGSREAANTFSVSGAASGGGARGSNGKEKRSEGPWNFQPATVLNNNGPLVQVVWGRGPGAQQDYLLTLGEDGRCGMVWLCFLFLSFFVSLPPPPSLRNGWEPGICDIFI